MSNVSSLEPLGIPTTSVIAAVNATGELIRDATEPRVKAAEIVAAVAGVAMPDLDNVKKETVVAQVVVQQAVLHGEFSGEAAVHAGVAKAESMAADPKYSFAFVKSEPIPDQSGTLVANVDGKEIKVEVKANGKIKKGGKQVLAAQLFEANATKTTAELVAIFVKELGMTKAGATTYVYNCRKKAGLVETGKRGRKAGSKVAKKEPTTPIVKKAKGRDKEADAAAKAAKTAAKQAKKATVPAPAAEATA